MIDCDDESRGLILKRLNRIEGQVRGVKRMIEDERDCFDIMKQVGAASGALHSLGREMLKHHLQRSLADVIEAPDIRQQMTGELLEVLDQFRR